MTINNQKNVSPPYLRSISDKGRKQEYRVLVRFFLGCGIELLTIYQYQKIYSTSVFDTISDNARNQEYRVLVRFFSRLWEAIFITINNHKKCFPAVFDNFKVQTKVFHFSKYNELNPLRSTN